MQCYSGVLCSSGAAGLPAQFLPGPSARVEGNSFSHLLSLGDLLGQGDGAETTGFGSSYAAEQRAGKHGALLLLPLCSDQTACQCPGCAAVSGVHCHCGEQTGLPTGLGCKQGL